MKQKPAELTSKLSASRGLLQAEPNPSPARKGSQNSATERVVGMGIVGPGAGEMIAEGVIAVEMGVVARDLADSIHAHPTLSETIMEAAESVFGQATHSYRPKKK